MHNISRASLKLEIQRLVRKEKKNILPDVKKYTFQTTNTIHLFNLKIYQIEQDYVEKIFENLLLEIYIHIYNYFGIHVAICINSALSSQINH